MEKTLDELKYPIGKFTYSSGEGELAKAIDSIRSLPLKLQSAVETLTDQQLDTHYRDGGWTLRQVVHHLADSHINAYARLKLAVTEENPEIRPYDEVRWAECEEAKNGEVELSLNLLAALHARMVVFLDSLSQEELARTYYHPANKKQSKINEVISMYAWHGEHHLAHITETIKLNGW